MIMVNLAVTLTVKTGPGEQTTSGPQLSGDMKTECA